MSVAFAASQRAAQVATGTPREQVGKGIAEQVALARRESPSRSSRHLGLAQALATELPLTAAALSAGVLTEWPSTLIAKVTACLSPADRGAVEARLAPRWATMSDRAVEQAARAITAELDRASVVQRQARAAADRCVTIRPAPDAMAYLTALLPVAQAVACYAALRKAGDTPAERGPHEAAYLRHYGPISAVPARTLLRSAPLSADPAAAAAQLWIRRLYTDPVTGSVIQLDRRRRRFPTASRELVVARDQLCRTPWCGAPIRHTDHVTAFADGGPSAPGNDQGLCKRCHQAKAAPGWRATTVPGPDESSPPSITTTTPTGASYTSHPPPALPGWHVWTLPPELRVEIDLSATG